jgi:hypothetical protein
MNFFRFIGWHKNFEKNNQEGFSKVECYCTDSNGFYITKRQASIATSLIIILITFMLIFGYLWGQRNAIQEFTSKVVADSFADQVNYSMYSMYGESANSEEEDSDESKENNNDIEEEQGVEQQIKKPLITNSTVKNDSSNVQNISNPQIQNTLNSQQTTPNTKYYAQLVGFGSRKNAEQFVNKLQKKGYTVRIMPRKSKTSNGKVITWYQAITENFADKAQLEEVVNEIKISERLSDIKFMTTTN